MNIILIFTLFFSFAATIFGQNELTKTPNGSKVLEYIQTFNSGDEQKLKTFFLENLSAEALKRRPIEAHLEFQRMVKNDFQLFEIRRVILVNEAEINLLVQGKSGDWAELSFKFEKDKLLGLQILKTDEPPNNVTVNTTPMTQKEFLSNVEDFLNEQSSADKFSGVVLIAKGDKPIFQKAYGLASKEKKTPNNLQTKFNLGSINKIFTRIAIGNLVAAGKVSFDDKLGKYLPDYPNKDAREKVTIRHLVTMKSGIGDFFGEKFIATPKDKLRKNSDFIPLFADKPLAFEPGTQNQYSNGGYILLGAIIEKVTGKSYYDYVRENIFKPAGMMNTDSFETDKMLANTADGYTRWNPNGELINNLETRPFRGSAAGGGYSNAADLLKFSLALKSGKVIIPDDDGKPQKDSGLGIAGGSGGINAIFLVNPQSGFTIIVLSNYDPPSAEKVGEQIRNWTRQIKN